ncbi:MAG: DUF3108 domain-containing protein [Daejeonella sp.]|uniref:DUF3108 domain-containing protein n=1 Tax=Daejeonella sp. JGW-45 TaxID=3034148 RepID=UPI0023EB1063|nr:DUF3108 domain-containing protein [Daejeonella sp. JGW-45]
MKYRLLVILLLVCISGSYAQGLQNVKEPVFQVGEQLNYKLRYGFITAAEASIRVEDTDVKFDNKPVFHLVAEGRTAGSFNVFYKVRNRYDSYIDRKELTPYLYTENIREANYRRTDRARFYQDQKKIVSNKGTFKGDGQTFDVVSAYYFARSIDMSDLRIGSKFSMNYFLDDGVTKLEVQYVGKERVKTALGYFNCLKFSPSIQPGRIFRKDSKLYLWITDDGNRIPVKAQVEILVGSVTLELMSAKGLKYPLAVGK